MNVPPVVTAFLSRAFFLLSQFHDNLTPSNSSADERLFELMVGL